MKRPEVASTDLEVLTQARPYLRSTVALLLYLRFAGTGDPLDLSYETADEFLNRLAGDVSRSDAEETNATGR